MERVRTYCYTVPSGCGKTRLAADIVLEFVRRGGVAVTVRVKNYTDSFVTVLNREAELLAVPSAAKLLSAAQRLQRPILFVVDGYNECDGSMREFLTLELSAWVRRYMANFLITSQTPLMRDDLLAFRTLEVPPAKMETKVTIARNIMGVDVLPKEIEHLLNAVSTGLEARLVGEVGQQLHPGSSRFALFDAYARKCLQDEAGEGIRALSHVAAWLFDHVSFSLSVRDLGRLMDDRQAGHAILERLQSAGLLSSHGDRVSFSHEMFFNAFAAEAIVRRSASQSEAILTALASPLHAERKDFIIGAIDEQLLLERVLEGLSDQTSVAACLSGSCGSRAQEWAEARWPRLLSRLHDEVRNVRFRIDVHGFNKVAFRNGSLAAWSPLDRAFLNALPKLIVEGRYLNEILDIIGTLDTRIDEESIRLRAEARKHDIPLRSSVFAVGLSPGFGPRSPAISLICQSIHSGFFQTDGERLSVLLHKHLSGDDLSNGQLYFLLGLFHVSSFNRSTNLAGTMPSVLTRVLKTHWNQAPYHLALALMEAVGDCYSASETDKAALIQAIESLPPPRNMWLSSSIVETLQMLGALEQSEIEHHPVVRQEVRQCLTSPNECASWEQAYRIYESQFDHPFMGAYHEIISSLPSHERKQLLMMAAKGSDKDNFFLGTLIAELASYSDPKVSESLARFTELPSTKSHSTQQAIDVFITAHIALARLGCPLPCSQAIVNSPSAESLAACGAILYWINRNDLDEGRKRKMCHPALSVLNRHRQSAALDALRLCDPRYSYRAERFPETAAVNRSILRWFPEEITKICRCALTQPEDLVGYFYFDERGSLVHAIDVLAQHGRNEDLSLLRRYAEDQDSGTRAIEAMKRIEQRS